MPRGIMACMKLLWQLLNALLSGVAKGSKLIDEAKIN